MSMAVGSAFRAGCLSGKARWGMCVQDDRSSSMRWAIA
jgi:hypothetical protein